VNRGHFFENNNAIECAAPSKKYQSIRISVGMKHVHITSSREMKSKVLGVVMGKVQTMQPERGAANDLQAV
jgi:hypothetical protein